MVGGWRKTIVRIAFEFGWFDEGSLLGTCESGRRSQKEEIQRVKLKAIGVRYVCSNSSKTNLWSVNGRSWTQVGGVFVGRR